MLDIYLTFIWHGQTFVGIRLTCVSHALGIYFEMWLDMHYTCCACCNVALGPIKNVAGAYVIRPQFSMALVPP